MYLIVDLVNPDSNTLTSASAQYLLEVSLCNEEYEASAPNGAAAITCGVTGGLDQTISDTADFFYMGAQIEQNAVLFALVDGGAATVGGFKLALTDSSGNEVQTFPADNNPIWGLNSSSIVGKNRPGIFSRILRSDFNTSFYRLPNAPDWQLLHSNHE